MSEQERSRLFNRDEVKDLLDLLQGTDVVEIEVENEGRKVRLRRGTAAPSPTTVTSEALAGPATSAAPAVSSPVVEEERGFVVKAPIVGSFYRSPSPDAPAFVEVGDSVNQGQVLCIIEAMKLMNEIEAETAGTLSKILVQNGESVEYGQPLFVIDPA